MLRPKEISTRLSLQRVTDPKAITIFPAPKDISGSRIPLHLGDEFLEFELDKQRSRVFSREYVLQPGKLCVGVTQESITLPMDVGGAISCRSTWGRLGVMIESATSVSPGYSGRVTFELWNAGELPILIPSGAPVIDMYFFEVENRIIPEACNFDSLVISFFDDETCSTETYTGDPNSAINVGDKNKHQVYLPWIVDRAEVANLRALGELEMMIQDPKLRERDLQKLFEEFPYLLAGPDYVEVRSQVMLQLDDGGSLIPDFFLQPASQTSLWDIVDIKRPKEKVIVHKRHRTRLSQVVMDGVAQLRTYSRYFDDQKNRDWVQSTYDIFAFRPRLTLVIGRSSHRLKPIEWRTAESDVIGVKILTYDELIRLARHRLNGRTKPKSGLH